MLHHDRSSPLPPEFYPDGAPPTSSQALLHPPLLRWLQTSGTRHIAPSSRSEDEESGLLAAAYPASPHLAASLGRDILSDVVLSTTRDASLPSPGQLRGTKIETLLSADAAPAAAADDDDDEADACYICLSSDGPMLVNVCACRTSRAHRRCLDELIRTKPDATCGVCRTKFVLHDAPLEVEDEPKAPQLSRSERARRLAWRVLGWLVTTIGLALLCVGGYGLVVPSEAGSGIGGGGVLSFMLLAGLLIFFWACHLAVQSDRYGGLTLSAGAQRGEPLRV